MREKQSKWTDNLAKEHFDANDSTKVIKGYRLYLAILYGRFTRTYGVNGLINELNFREVEEYCYVLRTADAKNVITE